jgi:glycosyltransferase involved in cell wall biosynthesis
VAVITVDVSVVVVTYNRAPMLQDALATLVNQSTGNQFSFEILVIDDGSTDNTADLVSSFVKHYPELVRYVYKRHGGEGDARNKGVEEARGQWIAFFDDDQLAEPAWLGELYRPAREHGADLVDGSVHLKLPDPCPLPLGPQARGILLEKVYSRAEHPGKVCLGTGNVLIRKSLFGALGGFDVSFRQCVDTEFFWRVDQAGVKMYYSPEAAVYHVIPDTRLRVSYLRETCYRIGVARARIHLKYQGSPRLVGTIFWRLGVALGRDLPFLLLSNLFQDAPLRLDSWCGLWYSLAFVRGSLFFLAPGHFPQRKFMNSLDFYYDASFNHHRSGSKAN